MADNERLKELEEALRHIAATAYAEYGSNVMVDDPAGDIASPPLDLKDYVEGLLS